MPSSGPPAAPEQRAHNSRIEWSTAQDLAKQQEEAMPRAAGRPAGSESTTRLQTAAHRNAVRPQPAVSVA